MWDAGVSGSNTKVPFGQADIVPRETKHWWGLGSRVEGEDSRTDSGRIVLVLGCGVHVLGKAQSPGVPSGWGTQHSYWIGVSELEYEPRFERSQAGLEGEFQS